MSDERQTKQDLIRGFIEQAEQALEAEDFPAVEWQLHQARLLAETASSAVRKAYDVAVTWQQDGETRHEFVRVFAGSRALAHDQAIVWARQGFDLEDSVEPKTSVIE